MTKGAKSTVRTVFVGGILVWLIQACGADEFSSIESTRKVSAPVGSCPSWPPANPDPDFCTAECPCAAGEGDCDSNLQCEFGLSCVPNVGPKYGMPASYDACEVPTCTAFDPGTPDPKFCSTGCQCGAGEGDCDYDDECAPGLRCVDNVGATYGLPATYDVCEGCPSFDPMTPDPDLCSPGCLCSEGQGDCDSDADCASGLTCVDRVGASYGLPASYGVCLADGCPTFNSSNPDPAFCSPACPCGVGEGDCDRDNECEPGLECINDLGAAYGLPATYDVCAEPGCPEFDSSNPDGAFCSTACPCDVGEGDCDSDSECAPGLVCINDRGAMYGLPSTYDVCVEPGCPEFDSGNPDSAFCSVACPCDVGEGDCDSDAECTEGNRCADNVGAAYGLPANYDACEPAVLEPLTFNSISPQAGYYPGNLEVTISGTGFNGATTVTVGGAACERLVVASPTQIRCFTPPGTVGAADVTVKRGTASVTSNSAFTYNAFTRVDTIAGGGSAGNVDGTGDVARFSASINGLRAIGTTLYVADGPNYKIRTIDLSGLDLGAVQASDVVVATLAGTGVQGTADSSDGTGATAQFQQPDDLAFLTGNLLYVTDTEWVNFPLGASTIREVNRSTGETLTVLGGADGYAGASQADGFVYVAECGGDNTIKRWQIGTSNVVDFVGTPGVFGDADGVGAAAQMNCPYGLTLDPAQQNIYFTDWVNQKVKRVTIATQAVTTIAGTGAQGFVDGEASSAQFDAPNKISAASGHLFVGEMDNCTVRQIDLQTSQVSTLAGSPTTCSVTDGPLASATFAGVVAVHYSPTYGIFVGSGNWGWRGNPRGYRVRLIH